MKVFKKGGGPLFARSAPQKVFVNIDRQDLRAVLTGSLLGAQLCCLAVRAVVQ